MVTIFWEGFTTDDYFQIIDANTELLFIYSEVKCTILRYEHHILGLGILGHHIRYSKKSRELILMLCQLGGASSLRSGMAKRAIISLDSKEEFLYVLIFLSVGRNSNSPTTSHQGRGKESISDNDRWKL